MELPRRVHGRAHARAEFGDSADAIWAALRETDPPADRCVEDLADRSAGERQALIAAGLRGDYARGPSSLRDLIEPLRATPSWVDWDRLEQGGVLLRRAGVLGGVVLGLGALVHGYAAPAGNKPLVMTGRLERDSSRRLAETARFVTAVGSAHGLRPGGQGFDIAIRVRLMHAQVRRLVLVQGGWQEDCWGAPINQHDMLSTILLFSTAFTSGLKQLGMALSQHECDDYVHLWRRVGELMGVTPSLLPHDDHEASDLARLISSTQGPPDDDARRLTRALLDSARIGHATTPRLGDAHVRFAEALCRHLVGDPLADALGIPRTAWGLAVPVLRNTTRTWEWIRQRAPLADRWTVLVGSAYWKRVAERGLTSISAAFGLPETLAPAS